MIKLKRQLVNTKKKTHTLKHIEKHRNIETNKQTQIQMNTKQTTGIVKRTSVTDVMRRLLQPKNILMSAPTKRGCYISLLNIIQGEVDPSEVKRRKKKKKKCLSAYLFVLLCLCLLCLSNQKLKSKQSNNRLTNH